MVQRPLARAALAILVIALAACGGGSSPQAEEPDKPASAESPADARVTLDAYSATRTSAVVNAVVPEDTLRAALALALPPLQDEVFTSGGQVTMASRAIVLPALQAARIDVLRASAAGETLAQLEAALPAAATADATRALRDGVSRQLWAPTSALFAPSFLASTDTGGRASVPWQASPIQDGSAAMDPLTEFGDISHLNLAPETRLLIGQRFDLDAWANGQAVAFDGVGVVSPDSWYTAPMVAFEGPGGTLTGADHTATATWVGAYLWVSVRPLGDEPLYVGLSAASLGSALLAAWSAFPAPEGLLTQSRQVWPQQGMTLEDRSMLPAAIALPYSAVQANLSGLDGGGTYLTEIARATSLVIDSAGLRVSGAQAMEFTFSADNQHGGGSYGVGVVRVETPPYQVPLRCPRAVADWRGAYLALIDRAGRIVLVASLPDARGVAVVCTPI